MIHHRSFWPGAWKTGGISLHDESHERMSEVTKESMIKENITKEGITKANVISEEAVKKDAAEMSVARENMLILLEQMQQKGVKLFVDGEAALPGEIAARAVCEGSTYMADYVLGDTGALEQIRFDRVTGR